MAGNFDKEFIESNFEKYDSDDEYEIIEVYPNYDMSSLCREETNLKYSDRLTNLYWTKPSKRNNFLEKFRSVSIEYMRNAYDKFDKIDVIDDISREYENFFDKVRQKDGEIIKIDGEDFKSDCLAHFFVRMMKMLGFVMKQKPRTEVETYRFKDVFVQEMFMKAHEDNDNYFYLIYFRQPESENGYEMVVLDDYIFNSIIQNLIKNIEDFQSIEYTTKTHDRNFPQCCKVVYTAYVFLWNFVHNFSVDCQNFILN